MFHQDDNDAVEDHQQHQQPQQLGAASPNSSSYYKIFDEATNNGRVFVGTVDYDSHEANRTTLTSAEVTSRNEYAAVVKTLRKEYKKSVHPVARK